MSQIIFAETNRPPSTRLGRGVIVYRGDTGFFVEASRIENDLAEMLPHALFEIRGSLVEIEGAWFEGAFERQIAFLFGRGILDLDLKVFMRSLNCCAIRLYQVEHSTTEAAFLLIGHERPDRFQEKAQFLGELKPKRKMEIPMKFRAAFLASYRMNRVAAQPPSIRRASFLS